MHIFLHIRRPEKFISCYTNREDLKSLCHVTQTPFWLQIIAKQVSENY